MITKIEKGDIVLVTGFTRDSNGLKKLHRKLAKVITVGKYDIFAINTPKSTYDLPFRVPLGRCQKIEINKTNIEIQDVKIPKVGNLVFSLMSESFGKIKQNIGLVKEIIDIPGDSKRAVLKHSTSEIKVLYDSLIILED